MFFLGVSVNRFLFSWVLLGGDFLVDIRFVSNHGFFYIRMLREFVCEKENSVCTRVW